MRRLYPIFIGLVVLAGLVAAEPPKPEGQPDPAKIDRLIRQLGSRKFSEREAATRALENIGVPALDSLKAATKSPDREVRTRAEALVKSVREHAENTTLLAAEHIHVRFKNIPVEQAVTEFARISGYPMVLIGDKHKLADRTVDLDTGETTFWRAFDRFCDAAGLIEAPPPARPTPFKHHPMIHTPNFPVPPPPPSKRGAALPAGGAAALIALAIALPPALAAAPPAMRGDKRPADDRPNLANSSPLRLIDGKPPHVPTSYYEAVRIHVRPPRQAFPANRQFAGPVVGLTIDVEPRLRWVNTRRVQIARALDTSGQALISATRAGPSAPLETSGASRAPSIPVQVLPGGFLMPNLAETGRITLLFKPSAQPSRRLKELKGTIDGNVLIGAQTLLRVPDPLKAAKKTVASPTGGSLKITQVQTNKDGSYVIGAAITRLPGVIPGVPQRRPSYKAKKNGQGGPANAPVKGLVLHLSQSTTYGGLTALDAEGEPIPIVSVGTSGYGPANHWTEQIKLTLKPHDKQGPPAELIFTASRIVSVTVPFELKDVQLR